MGGGTVIVDWDDWDGCIVSFLCRSLLAIRSHGRLRRRVRNRLRGEKCLQSRLLPGELGLNLLAVLATFAHIRRTIGRNLHSLQRSPRKRFLHRFDLLLQNACCNCSSLSGLLLLQCGFEAATAFRGFCRSLTHKNRFSQSLDFSDSRSVLPDWRQWALALLFRRISSWQVCLLRAM